MGVATDSETPGEGQEAYHRRTAGFARMIEPAATTAGLEIKAHPMPRG